MTEPTIVTLAGHVDAVHLYENNSTVEMRLQGGQTGRVQVNIDDGRSVLDAMLPGQEYEATFTLTPIPAPE
jgi:hypothetical protein